MRFEGEDRWRQAFSACDGRQASKQRTMAEVNAIEIADGEHCGAGGALSIAAINEHSGDRDWGKMLDYNGFAAPMARAKTVKYQGEFSCLARYPGVFPYATVCE
jgi:hypothetical protein